MEKILVTTDFSNHSKAGLRFAIQLATQKEVELVFFHCFQALIPTTIHRERIENAIQEQARGQLKNLEKFVSALYKSMKIMAGAHKCVVVEDLNPEHAILHYAHHHAINYICMSTRGAGTLLKIIGTNTSNVILKSPVPVLVVPHTYRTQPVQRILYASDLENIHAEMPKVATFAQSLSVPVDLAHFYYPGRIPLDQETLTAMWKQKHSSLDRVFLEQFDLDEGFVAQLSRLAKKAKPSIVVFFTQTNRTWFDKIFRIGRSEGFSFVTKKPMLVYRKG